MADKMDIDTSNGVQEKGEEKTGGPVVPTEMSTEKIISTNFALINQAVDSFDPRFTLRALRSIATLRKREDFAQALGAGIRQAFPKESNNARRVLEEMLPESVRQQQNGSAETNGKKDEVEVVEIAEVWAYLGVLVQVYLLDTASHQAGATFSLNLVDKLRSFNRRTMDPLGSKAYLYLSLFHENLTPLPPSPQSPVISLRPKLLAALRSAVIRNDSDTQAAVTVLLLRNYISTADITQADLLVAQTQFPATAANNQVCRYLYYLGRIRAIQLAYTEAHSNLEAATRKSPTTGAAVGFYQQATKMLIVVELLMGDIPDRATFRLPVLEKALAPYFKLVQAVRVGDLGGFVKCVDVNEARFRADGTYTLILRLRQNVIKTGVRMLSLSYSRISLRDICTRLSVESEESAEYITAKAIRDSVIPDSRLDHENGYLVTTSGRDVYGSTEPSEAFHERIGALLGMRDECVRAMRYPGNRNREAGIEAQKARERERELVGEVLEAEDEEDEEMGGGMDGL
ncbi:26S proteasome non-ATPase regulatory subunit [Elasticomyces elasticus]|uniref:26S proteasome non-ATPase regulatory subunit n=1 Tax=Elasticomyces elasticus TaxID=574655 RepID=A0AAN8A4V4_9PEZI|nr:26S proteasome non-ATPase regulatory subunit [Elasticomyces elasticus]